MTGTRTALRRKWARVVARATSPWEREFAAKIAGCLRQDGWSPTAKQAAAIERMCREHDAGTPEFGEMVRGQDGVLREYNGAGVWIVCLGM
jgi:hypothetical protein